jgi:hypothetical protein
LSPSFGVKGEAVGEAVGVATTEDAVALTDPLFGFLCARAGDAISSADAVITDAPISAALFLIVMSSSFVGSDIYNLEICWSSLSEFQVYCTLLTGF